MISELLFALLTNGVNLLTSPGILHNQQAYNEVLRPMLRFVFAGILAVTVGSLINIYIISRLKVAMSWRFFILRSIGSTMLGDIAVAVISGLISYVDVLPLSKVVSLLAAGYLFTVVYSLIAVIPAAMLVSFLKKREGFFVLDNKTKFNPFSLSLE